ncbi:MAG TPA: hypothetical protein PKD70_13850 [Saprospiraceae bacterium]|nr:hypothetical protein [Saprospiraceae bacterium]HMP14956.1 hypothetical protein [Saprospiraceae bacterium]
MNPLLPFIGTYIPLWRAVALVLVLLLVAALIYWFANPNVAFRRLEKAMQTHYQQKIQPFNLAYEGLRIPDKDALRLEQEFCDYYYPLLQKPRFKKGLNTKNQAAQAKLEAHFHDRILFLQQLKRNPALYNLGGELKATLSNDSVPLVARLERIGRQLALAPTYYANAKDYLTLPDTTRLELAIRKQLYALQWFNMDLQDSLQIAALPPAPRDTLEQRLQQARIAVKDYIAFCRSLLFESRASM